MVQDLVCGLMLREFIKRSDGVRDDINKSLENISAQTQFLIFIF